MTVTNYFIRPAVFSGSINGLFHQMRTELPRNTNSKSRLKVVSCACGVQLGAMFEAADREAAYASHIEAVRGSK